MTRGRCRVLSGVQVKAIGEAVWGFEGWIYKHDHTATAGTLKPLNRDAYWRMESCKLECQTPRLTVECHQGWSYKDWRPGQRPAPVKIYCELGEVAEILFVIGGGVL